MRKTLSTIKNKLVMKKQFSKKMIHGLLLDLLSLTNLRYNLYKNVNQGEPLTYDFFRGNIPYFKKLIERNPERGLLFFENLPKYQHPGDEDLEDLIRDRSFYSKYALYFTFYYNRQSLLDVIMDNIVLEYLLRLMDFLYSKRVRPEIRKNVDNTVIDYMEERFRNGDGSQGVLKRMYRLVESEDLKGRLEEIFSQTIRKDETAKENGHENENK